MATDWFTNFFNNVAGASGAGPATSGINPELHPRGSRTRSQPDPLGIIQSVLGGKERTLQNLRSPMVRRSAGGRVVDENAPEGLDWLKANGPERSGQPVHSWDQPNYSPFSAVEAQRAQELESAAQPQLQQSASGVRSMMGPYGGGFGTGVDEPVEGDFVAQPMQEGYTPFEPMLAAEQDANAANVLGAYNETLTNPLQSPVDAGQEARRAALSRVNAGVQSGALPAGRGLVEGESNVMSAPAEQQGSVTMPTNNPQGVNNYTPFDVASPLSQSALDPNTTEAELQTMYDVGVGDPNLGLLPSLWRQGQYGVASLMDYLEPMLWRRPDTRDINRKSVIEKYSR